MKNEKSLNKFISIILVFVISLSLMPSIKVNADAGSTRSKMIKDHFESLGVYEYNPPNMSVTEMIDGTCAFVAMSMLLSYYDTYWNDAIVDDRLEWQKGTYYLTTDVLDSTFNANNEVDAWERKTVGKYAFIQANKDKYLQSYLIDMCNRLPIIDELGVMAYQTQDVLEYYLYEDHDFDETQIKVHLLRADNDSEKETMINTAKDLINDGHPVIFSGLDFAIEEEEIGDHAMDIGAHSMIGFDYTEEPEGYYDITLNLCWNGSGTQTIRTTQFQFVNSIIWLEIIDENFPHDCSNNYCNPNDGTEYCACQVYYNTHPAHEEHHYSVSGKLGSNGVYHWTNACNCGEIGPSSVICSSDLSYIDIPGSNFHHQECEGCGYSGFVEHSFSQLTSISDTHHANACKCGAVSSTQEAHTPSRCVSNSTSSHSIYCKCGYLISQDLHEMTYMSTWLSKCIHCGYVRDNRIPGQIIMGMEEEYDICKE